MEERRGFGEGMCRSWRRMGIVGYQNITKEKTSIRDIRP